MFRLFPPIDEVVARRKAARLREEAVEVCIHIMKEILSSLPLEGVDQQRESVGEDEREKVKSDNKVTLVEAETEDEEVSDEERVADRDIRHRILLHLLQLACAMVSTTVLSGAIYVLMAVSIVIIGYAKRGRSSNNGY